MDTPEFLSLSLTKLGVMAASFVFAAKPGEAWMFHETDAALDMPVDPVRAVELIRFANLQLSWLPRHSWYEPGHGRTGYLHAMRCRPDLCERGFDFFCLSQ